MDWPKVIKEVLDHHDMNQLELSKKTGISKSHVNCLILGRRKHPSFDMGLAILKLHPNKKEYLK